MPFLFQLDTVAYFPIIRGKHSYQTIAKIRDTTQLLLDVYSLGKQVFVRPLKVWNRYSESMFLPHNYEKETGRFHPDELEKIDNSLTKILPDVEGLTDIIGVYEVSQKQSYVYHDMREEHLMCTMM